LSNYCVSNPRVKESYQQLPSNYLKEQQFVKRQQFDDSNINLVFNYY